jgi:hypothetical protein
MAGVSVPSTVRLCRFAAAAAGWALLTTAASGAEGVRVPAAGFSEGWEADGPERRFAPGALTRHINGGAELVLEFGFRELTVRYFRKGEASLSVELYRMESPDASVGVYLAQGGAVPGSLKTSAETTAGPEGTAWITRSPTQWLARRGPFFLAVLNPDGDTLHFPAMNALIRRTFKPLKKDGPFTVLRNLPAGRWSPGSLRLFRGPVALETAYSFGTGDVFRLGGTGFGAFAAFRDSGRSAFTGLRIPYPDRARARFVLDSLPVRLDPSIRLVDSFEDGFTFRDDAGEYGDVVLDGSSLVIRVRLNDRPGRPGTPTGEDP